MRGVRRGRRKRMSDNTDAPFCPTCGIVHSLYGQCLSRSWTAEEASNEPSCQGIRFISEIDTDVWWCECLMCGWSGERRDGQLMAETYCFLHLAANAV